MYEPDSKRVKYYTDVQPGYVFNMDVQDWTRKFVIVTEGPFDAITISGVSILGSEINDIQRELIEGLNRQIIVIWIIKSCSSFQQWYYNSFHWSFT